MAEDMNVMRAYGGLSPFESFMISEKSSKRASGTAIAGITVASVAAAAAIGAWIFGGTYGAARSNQAREAANAANQLAQANHTNTLALLSQAQANQNATIDRIITALNRETDARANGDITLSNSVNDTLSGQQASNLTAQQASELSAVQSVQTTLLTDAITGRSSLNPTPVSLYSSPQPCNCPGCGA